MCEIHDVFILNGLNSPAAYTCHTGRGESTVDYILCNYEKLQIRYTELQKCKITDHDLLCTTLPMLCNTRTSSPTGLPTHATTANIDKTTGPLAERVGNPKKDPPENKNKNGEIMTT
jgi:hypothetical protein